MTVINKTLGLNFISSNSIQPKVRKTRAEHKDTICSNCGSNFTSGSWCRTYNKDGSWDIGRYHCHMCHTYFNPDTGEFSKNPKVVHKNTVCSSCGSNCTSTWLKKYDENGNWSGKYICNACYYNPACRSGELNPNSTVYKGMIGVETVAKVLGDKDCTIMKQGSPFDICSIQSIGYGRVEVKTTTYRPKYGMWVAGSIKPGLFDTLFVICTDNKFENVIRIYIISEIKVCNISNIAIIENPSRYVWYEEFRINDIVLYQKAFQIVKNENQISKNYADSDQNSMSTKEKGDICEEIVKIAISAEVSTDISCDLVHEKYKRIEVKGSSYYLRRKHWTIVDIQSYKFDTLFMVCMSSNFEEVKRVYIIPKKDVVGKNTVTVVKNHSKSGWYEEFRIDNIKPYQEAFQTVKNDSQLTINN